MRLVGYGRVNGPREGPGRGLPAQERTVRRWAERKGHVIVDFVSDAIVRPGDRVADRPGLAAAVARVGSGKADALVVEDLNRLGQGVDGQEAIFGLLRRSGSRVFIATLGEGPGDERYVSIDVVRNAIGQFADLDAAVRLVRTRESRQASRAAGGHAGGAYPYGVTGEGSRTRRRSMDNADEMAVVARVVELRRGGASYRQICQILTTEGYRPRRAATWSPMVVRAIYQRGPNPRLG